MLPRPLSLWLSQIAYKHAPYMHAPDHYFAHLSQSSLHFKSMSLITLCASSTPAARGLPLRF